MSCNLPYSPGDGSVIVAMCCWGRRTIQSSRNSYTVVGGGITCSPPHSSWMKMSQWFTRGRKCLSLGKEQAAFYSSTVSVEASTVLSCPVLCIMHIPWIPIKTIFVLCTKLLHHHIVSLAYFKGIHRASQGWQRIRTGGRGLDLYCWRQSHHTQHFFVLQIWWICVNLQYIGVSVHRSVRGSYFIQYTRTITVVYRPMRVYPRICIYYCTCTMQSSHSISWSCHQYLYWWAHVSGLRARFVGGSITHRETGFSRNIEPERSLTTKSTPYPRESAYLSINNKLKKLSYSRYLLLYLSAFYICM